MNKVVIPAILTATVLIAGLFAFMPIEKAETVHTSIIAASGVSIHALLKTLPDDGTDVTWTFTADKDLIVKNVWHDNTPTIGLCTLDEGVGENVQDICVQSSFRILLNYCILRYQI